MCKVQGIFMQDDQNMKIQSIYSQVMKESLCVRLDHRNLIKFAHYYYYYHHLKKKVSTFEIYCVKKPPFNFLQRTYSESATSKY